MLMAARGGSVLVHDDAEHLATAGALRTSCAGILSPKDLLFRLVARELPPRDTPVSELMTPAPHTLPASASVLDALAQLQGSGYRTVPVLCASGEPLGVLSILELISLPCISPVSPLYLRYISAVSPRRALHPNAHPGRTGAAGGREQ